ncbi:MAG: HAD-IA family hydrolase [Eubacteriales bacterium]
MKKKNLALFDLDGTLFNTNDVNYHAYKMAMEDNGFYTLDYAYYCAECNGRHYTTFLPKLTSTDPSILESIHKAKKKYYAEYLELAKVNTHLFDMATQLKDTYHLAIVTTASKKNCMDILQFYGKDNLFELILTADDIIKPKPDPEGFLQAMTHFKIDANRTIIFEDSDVGVEAANATGATVFRIEQF